MICCKSISRLLITVLLEAWGSGNPEYHRLPVAAILFRQEDYFIKEKEELHHQVKWLVPNAQKNAMEPMLLTLAPHGISEIQLPREAEEFGYVLKGSVKLYYGPRSFTVKQGESFYFKAEKKHSIENCSNRESVILWVSTPPSF